MKRSHMSFFEEIVAQFPPMFEGVEGLAEELRDILFGTEKFFWELMRGTASAIRCTTE